MKHIKQKLDSLLQDFCGKQFVQNDPLGMVKGYRTHADMEVAAFISSAFAFGNIKSILATLDKIRVVTGDSIQRFAKKYSFDKNTNLFENIRYRWITPQAISALFYIIGRIIRKYKSIEAFFAQGKGKDLKSSIDSFCSRALALAPDMLSVENTRKLRYFFASPKRGGASKRLCLFLRWVVRKSKPDIGLWTCLTPAELIIPLDIHVARVATELGLTDRKTRDWKMAVEITEALKKFAPEDPLKYDFAIHKRGFTSRSRRARGA